MTQEGSTMAHRLVQGGRGGHRYSENRLARDAKGPSPCAAPWALVVTGLIVTLAGASGGRGQQPPPALSPFARALVPAQPPRQPERLGQPRGAAPTPPGTRAPPPLHPLTSLHPRL